MVQAHGRLYGADPALLSPLAARLLERGVLKWVITIAASLGAILEVIDTSITNVALPQIRGNLGASLSEAGWIITAYACANVIIIPLSAWLGERFGRKNYFVFSLVGFTVASVLCGLAPNLTMLVVARILQGLAGGGLLAKAQSLVFEAFAPEERGAAQAIFGLGVIAGPALGPVLGGYLTDTMGWRWIFFINIPFGLLASAACIAFLPWDREEDLNKKGQVDWTGIALLTVGLGCLQTVLEEGQQDDWFSSQFIATMAVTSVVALGFFIWQELRTAHPAVDLRVLKYPSMIGGSLYSAILGMGLYGIIFAVPIFVQDYLHFTPTQSGELQIPGAIASAITLVIFGKFSGRFDPRLLIAVGALMTSATGVLLMGLNPGTGVDSLILPLVLRGVGSVIMFMPLSIATIGPLPKKDIAAGAGLYSLTRQLGSSIGIAFITTMLVRQEAIHRSDLVEKVTAFRMPVLDRIDTLTGTIGSGDPVLAQHRALSAIDGIVNGQAALLSYGDIFFYVAVAFTCSLPLLFLLGDGKSKAAREAAESAH